MSNKIRWEEIDPQKRKVVYLYETYEAHLENDHAEKDVTLRKSIEPQVRETIRAPQYIYEENDSSRHLYYNAIAIPKKDNTVKMKILKVVVDADREPNEVVTWLPLRKGDTVKDGAMIYERGKDNVSDK